MMKIGYIYKITQKNGTATTLLISDISVDRVFGNIVNVKNSDVSKFGHASFKQSSIKSFEKVTV